MADTPRRSSTALGGLVGLVAREVGAAVAVVGGLCVGFTSLSRASSERDPQWPLYLVAGGVFVAVLVACRWRGGAEPDRRGT